MTHAAEPPTTAPDAHTHSLHIGRHRVLVSYRGGADMTAPPLLLLMGLGGNIGMWEPLRSMLAERGGMATVAFDVPGTGGSQASRLPLTMPAVGRLAVRVLDELDIRRVDVLGLSWGGLLAQQLALSAPSRLRRVVLANTNFGMGSVPGSPAALSTLLTLRRYRSAAGLTHAVRALGAEGSSLGRAGDPHSLARLAQPPSRRGYYYQLFSPLGWSSLAQLWRIPHPTLVLAGGADTAVPVINARILARLIPQARLRVIPGGGHLVLFERPQVVAELVTQFLGDTPA